MMKWADWRVAVVAVVVALAGCGKNEAELIEAAKSQLAQNDRAGATIQLKNALQKNPDSAEARYLLGKVLLEGGSAGPAEVELQRALELGYPAPKIVPLMARSMLGQGKPARVTSAYATTTWPDAESTADLKTSVAAAWLAQGSSEEAKAAVDAALFLQPNLEAAILLKARLTAQGGNMAAALGQVEGLLARNPKSAEAWTLKGDLLLGTAKDHGPAIEAYKQAVAANPQLVSAYAALISLYVAERHLDEATKQLEALRAVAPKSLVTVMLDGQLALAKGDLRHAREQFQLVLRAMPNHVAALQAAGQTELGLNSLEQAETLLTKAAQLAPAAIAPRLLLAQTHLRQNQPAKAQSDLEPLLERDNVPVQVLMLSAQAALVSGDAATAEALFRRAAKAAPDDPKIRTALALSHLSKGKADSALAELQAVSESDTGISADLAMVSTLIRQGKTDEALKAIDAMAKKQPDRPLADQLRGQVLMRKNDREGARKSFEQALAKDPTYFPAAAALAGLDVVEKHFDKAKVRFTTFLQKSPGNLQAMMALAEVAARSNAPRSEVTALIEAAIKANPNELAPRLSLIDYLLSAGDAKAALTATQAALTALPDRTELIERLGRCQFALGDREQAAAAYNRLVTLKPKLPTGYLGLADVAQARGDTAGAAREVRRALEIAPDSAPVQRAAIESALRDKHPERALAVARKVQSQHPNDAAGFLYEGEIALQGKDWTGAEAAFRKAIGKQRGAVAPARVHATLLAAGKTAQADQFSATWRRDHPKDMVFVLYLGDDALARGDQVSAERWYRAVLDKNPDNPIALNNIAWLMVAQHKPGALALAEKAVSLSPDQPQLLDTLAQAQAAEGQVSQAVETAQQALALAPGDASIRFNLAKFLLASGNKRQAKLELDRLAALGKSFPKQDEVAQLLKQLVPG